jgi:hypothetical protein
MSANDRKTYDLRIDDYQRRIIGSALLTYITEGGFQGQATKEDLEEATVLQSILGDQSHPLATEGVNDLTPDF